MDILMIAPACDGEDVGEAWVAFQWAKLLSERFQLTLLTTYKRGHTPSSRQLPGVRVVEWEEPAGVGRFERLNSLMQPGYVPFYIRARRWIRRRLASGERFDIAHQVVPVAMRYPSPASELGIPLVVGPVGGSLESPPGFVEEEGATPWWQQLRTLDAWRIRRDPVLRRTFESAACVVGVAPYVEEFLSPVRLRRLEIMSETAVHEVPDPIDRTGRACRVGLLYVGRIIRTKGLRDVIRALDLVRDLDVTLDVVGDGNDREACEQLASELGVDTRVMFHGKLPREAVDAFYERADVFVFPSYREPGGNVSLEAMSFSLPLIVCRRGGPGANVDDSCAIRLNAESPAQLSVDCAAAIRTLVEDSALRHRMGAAAREHVATTHLWSQRVDRMVAIYQALAADDDRGRSIGHGADRGGEICEERN
jgi:glycosyltransferase involved in cell wall biosynthesis